MEEYLFGILKNSSKARKFRRKIRKGYSKREKSQMMMKLVRAKESHS